MPSVSPMSWMQSLLALLVAMTCALSVAMAIKPRVPKTKAGSALYAALAWTAGAAAVTAAYFAMSLVFEGLGIAAGAGWAKEKSMLFAPVLPLMALFINRDR
ncbi:MAG: hypothetical protein HUK26_06765 [Duodenibacillus sp.]|nr:hypothetical protein [Duodenibacillus sp.]